MSTLFSSLHNEFWEVAWVTFPSICSRICVLASRIVELTCCPWGFCGSFWESQGALEGNFSCFGRHSGSGCAWRAISGFLGSSGPFEVILFRTVSGAKISEK